MSDPSVPVTQPVPLPRPGAQRRRGVSAAPQAWMKEEELFPGEALPLVLKPAFDNIDLAAWLYGHRELLEERLLRHGGILFRGFDVASAEAFEGVVAAVVGKALPYDDRMAPRSEVTGNIFTSTNLASDRVVLPHNESSYSHHWPRKILFFCQTAASQGGATPIADCRRISRRLPSELVESFARLGVMYVRNFGHGLGLPWQEVYQTNDPAAVEAYCREARVHLEWLGGDRLRTWQVRPAVIRHPATGDLVWFNQVPVFHVSMQPAEVCRELRAAFSDEDLPIHVFFGDGSPIPDEVVATIYSAYEAELRRFVWKRGDVMLLDNLLSVHARDPFQGTRRVLVGMGEACGLEDVGFVEPLPRS